MTVHILCNGEPATASFRWRERQWVCDHCGTKVKVAW